MKIPNNLKYVFRVLPGILFLFSATAKLIGIDAFEIYIFSFKIVGLSLSYLAARLIIAAEYILGILLIANFRPKLAFWGSVAILVGFTAFLAVLALNGNEENCNCFGELVNLSPSKSIIKNIITLAILLLSAGIRPFNIKWKPLWLALSIIVPLATVFIVSPPDNWRYDNYSRHTSINEEAFKEALESGTLPPSVAEGDHIVCFYSLKCRFCKMSAQKIVVLRERGEFSQAPIIGIIGRGEDTDTSPFIDETGIDFNEQHFIEPTDFLKITNGVMPLILVMHDDTIVAKYGYRDLH